MVPSQGNIHADDSNIQLLILFLVTIPARPLVSNLLIFIASLWGQWDNRMALNTDRLGDYLAQVNIVKLLHTLTFRCFCLLGFLNSSMDLVFHGFVSQSDQPYRASFMLFAASIYIKIYQRLMLKHCLTNLTRIG